MGGDTKTTNKEAQIKWKEENGEIIYGRGSLVRGPQEIDQRYGGRTMVQRGLNDADSIRKFNRERTTTRETKR